MAASVGGRGPVGGGGARPVVVVEGGVSGCACAATLVAMGLEVTLVNGTLDRVGLPAFGPDLLTGAGGRAEVAQTLATLPEVLRDVWTSAMVSPRGAPFVCVDRRMVSIETKRALENMPALKHRQGLVSDLKVEGSGRNSMSEGGRSDGLSVGTVFGEWLQARAVVVAVGLSLGGQVVVGEVVVGGGRYGETSADGLRVALERLGARFREVSVEVGPRFLGGEMWRLWRRRRGGSGDGRGRGGFEVKGKGARTVPLERERVAGDAEQRWSAEYPPAPHWTDSLWAQEAGVAVGEDGGVRPLISPDGVATGEVHLVGESRWRESSENGGTETRRHMLPAMACRPEEHVRGLVVTNVSESGRLAVGGGGAGAIWVTGRAGGAAGYLESLLAGVRTGIDAAAALGAGG